MSISLKDLNKAPLLAIVVANLGLYIVVLQTGEIFSGEWAGFARAASEALPAGFGVVLVGILNAQFSSEVKARIVFLRWNNPLPGSEAFTRYGAKDPRVEIARLERAYGPLPTDPQEQNRLWYRLFKSVDSDKAVSQAHREFLFSRDYACLSLMMLVVLGSTGLVQFNSPRSALAYAGVLTLQFVLALGAAQNHGRRLVTTVLALKSAGC